MLLGWWQERRIKGEYVLGMLENALSVRYAPGDPFICRQHFIRKLCERAGVKPFGFHAIRHFAAVILYGTGEPVSTIRKILRRQEPATTERYLASSGFGNDQMRGALENPGNGGPARMVSFPPPKKMKTLCAAAQKARYIRPVYPPGS